MTGRIAWQQCGDSMSVLSKIALEEHCMTPGMEEYWLPSVAGVPPETRTAIAVALADFHDQRIALMDSVNVEFSILSLAGPGGVPCRVSGGA